MPSEKYRSMCRIWIYAGFLSLILATFAGYGNWPAFAQKDKPASSVTVPAPIIGVITFQRVIRRSLAGKSIREQIDAQQSGFQSGVKNLQSELKKARLELSERPAAMTDAEFKKRRQVMRKRVADLQSLVQRRKRDLDQIFNAGMRQVDLALVEVLKNLAKEHGINLILNAGRGRGLVLFAENRIVITEEALRRLNERLPRIELSKPESAK